MSAPAATPNPTSAPTSAPASAPDEPRAPAWVTLLGSLVGIVLTLVALAGLSLAIVEIINNGGTISAWWAVLFLATVTAAGLFAAAMILGKFKRFASTTMFVAGGTALAAAPVTEPALMLRIVEGGAASGATVAGVPLINIAAAVGALGATLLALAGLGILLRAPLRTIPRLIVGGILAAIPLAALAIAIRMGALAAVLGSSANNAQSTSAGAAALTAAGAALALILGVLLFSAGVHFVITAFTTGMDLRENADKRRPA